MVDYAYDNVNLPPATGPQGPYGASDAFDEIAATLSTPQTNGARANLGINTGFGTATLSGPTVTGTNILTSTPRSRLTRAAAAGGSVAYRSGLATWWRGNAAGLGGFRARFRWAITSFLAGHRAFTGLRAIATEIGNVDPSTLVNIIGMGYDAAATQWSIMHNDAAGAATQVALGAGFNVNVNDLLELTIECAANAAAVDWAALNLSTGALQAGTIVADLPSSATMLSSHVWGNTGADATTPTVVDFVDLIVQTPTL